MLLSVHLPSVYLPSVCDTAQGMADMQTALMHASTLLLTAGALQKMPSCICTLLVKQVHVRSVHSIVLLWELQVTLHITCDLCHQQCAVSIVLCNWCSLVSICLAPVSEGKLHL